VKRESSRQIFEEYSNVKFHENPFRGNRVFPCGRTDRRGEANCRFSKLANVPENGKAPFVPEQTYAKLTCSYLSAYFVVFSGSRTIYTASNGGRLINYGFRRLSMKAVMPYRCIILAFFGRNRGKSQKAQG
jgi:hypothetical protein